jgi:hypothetical protein
LNTELTQQFVLGHPECIRLEIKQMVERLLNKMSDMDIPEKLYINISITDKAVMEDPRDAEGEEWKR